MPTMSDTQIKALLAEEPEWKLEDGKLVRDWSFKDFVAAMIFVNKIAALAEGAGHHPDIDIRYNKVRLGLVSHDAGGITERDANMARRISKEFVNA
jgi:4a-hydroxytetrahydrobiopterin dehydratase